MYAAKIIYHRQRLKGVFKMKHKVIHLDLIKGYRILEFEDILYCLEDLKGDTYSVVDNLDVPLDWLKEQELAFEHKIADEGVYGYVLQQWNSNVNEGWIHVDSCHGFVGRHEDENHYIVQSFIDYINKQESEV
jgi:hypothetical protein